VTLIKSVREICALSRGSWFVVRGSSGGVRYHRADRVWGDCGPDRIVLRARPRVAMSLAASGGRTSEPVTKEAP
jgi:hypothetical protein